MHRSLYEAIVEAKDRISKALRREERPAYDPPWERLEAGGDVESVVAVDGSVNQSNRTSHTIFALTGLSILFNANGEPDESAVSYVGALDRGVFRRKRLADVLTTWMSLAELRSLLKMDLPPRTLVLMDGSFVSDVINPKPTRNWLNLPVSDEEREQMDALEDELGGMDLYNRLVEEFDTYDFVAPNLLSTVAQFYPARGYRYLALALLLHRERLEAMRRLISRGYRLLFVSKDSSSQDYIRHHNLSGIYSDQVLFSLFTRGRGFAPPLKIDLSQQKYKLSGDDEDEDSYSDILETELYQTFVRLSEDYPVAYKVEFIGVDEREIPDVLSLLATLSPGGYPLPLEKVHREVVITYGDMELISQVVVPIELNLREMLR
ncbi:MAG: DNA double-strand break repair nuclease NurA [Thermotogae bacterium]|nr:DNA double-strand break repair nuclease NurA [Thermotogota bacterium]